MNESSLSDAVSKLQGMMEAKLESLTNEIRELKEADQELHKRISEKDKNVRPLESRVSRLESAYTTIKWLIGTLIGGAVALFTYFQRN